MNWTKERSKVSICRTCGVKIKFAVDLQVWVDTNEKPHVCKTKVKVYTEEEKQTLAQKYR